MDKSLEELKQEADALGIQYNKNIGAAKLSEKIDAYYDAESAANSTPVATKDEVEEEVGKSVKNKSLDPRVEAIKAIKELERENMKTEVVKVTMVDRRESNTATHAYFSSGDVAMNIPLDVYVEMPKILIKLAQQARALAHVDSNGATVSKLVPKYVVEYK